jgi:hypothetical protein
VSQSANVGDGGVPFVPLAMPAPSVFIVSSTPDPELLQELRLVSPRARVEARSNTGLLKFYTAKLAEIDRRASERASLASDAARSSFSDNDEELYDAGGEAVSSYCSRAATSSIFVIIVCLRGPCRSNQRLILMWRSSQPPHNRPRSPIPTCVHPTRIHTHLTPFD